LKFSKTSDTIKLRRGICGEIGEGGETLPYPRGGSRDE